MNRFQNHPKINGNLSCLKTESTIVLAMLQSTGRPKLYSATKEEQKMSPKWSSGRACGAASTTQRNQTTSKNFVRFQQKCIKNAQKWYQKQIQINEMMLERFPLRLEA